MNFQEAIKATQSIPHVITMFGNDAGPKLRVEVTKEAESFADLRVHARLMGRPPKKVLLGCVGSQVFVRCEADALVEANILAEHLRQQVPGAGHVTCVKFASDRFEIAFALPQPAELQLALPSTVEPPALEAPEAAPEKTTSKRSR